MSDKYEITDIRHETIPELRRIRALRDIPIHKVKAGDLGGFIHISRNLKQDGECWIAQDAMVCDFARVVDDAIATGNACLKDMSQIRDNSVVSGHAQLLGATSLSDNSIVTDHAKIYDSLLFDNASVSGRAQVIDCFLTREISITGDACLRGVKLSDESDIM